ncbi:MAG: hypothetical protein ACC645_18440 [Pirellulales bacterium]
MRNRLRSWPGTELLCRMLFGCALWIGCVLPALGASYYVSNSGDDRNTGTAASSPWQTLDKVNGFEFAPGDVIHFERDGVWHGQLVPRSGREKGHVTYTAYGLGAKPQVLGSAEKNLAGDWKPVGGNLWRAGPFPCDVGAMVFNNGQTWGSKVWDRSDVDTPRTFCYDPEDKTVILYAKQNPATLFDDVECALTRHIISEGGRHYVIYDGLHLAYGSAHGIGGGGTHHIIVRNCDLSFIGGGEQYSKKTPRGVRHTRYGNGIEFWNGAHDNLVENCRIWDIFDAGVTNQGSGKNAQYNITYRHNVIWNCSYSFEYWNRPADSSTHDIYFEDNLCFNAGEGACHGLGAHLMFFNNSAETTRFFVRRNVFHNAKNSAIVMHLGRWNGLDELVLSDNLYVQPPEKTLIRWGDKSFTAKAFAEYQQFAGKDSDSRLVTLRSLALEPASVSLRVGEARQIEAVAFYSDDTSVKVTPIARFASSDTSVVALDAFGMVRATRPGKTVVKGTFRGRSATTSVVVRP